MQQLPPLTLHLCKPLGVVHSPLPPLGKVPGIMEPLPPLQQIAHAKRFEFAPMSSLVPTIRNGNRVDGDASQGFVQVLLEEPDDALAMQMMRAAGVVFATAKSVIPRDGVLTCQSPPTKADKYAYRWRG